MTRICFLLLALFCTAASKARADEAFFRQRVAPILERSCVSCHEGSHPKGGLSLALREKSLAGGESGAAIVLGKPDESLLVDYISGDEPAMPQDDKPLSADEVSVLRKWIEAGAVWPEGIELVDKKQNSRDWWSLAKLKRPVVPDAKPSADAPEFTIRSPIDAFVLKKLQEQKLTPSPEADRGTLIRRLYFDLVGLPPTYEEVRAFVADADPQAYEKLVAKLLASERYGERWGRHWLDVVHYGDTHGYDKDQPRPNAWPYRDYVIRSFNEDKPYAQFVQEQLAGDMLFPGTRDGIEGLGFIAAGPWDLIGHAEVPEDKIDGKIARLMDRDDMVANAMNTFTSLTVQCARCHNHKFDPVTQEDYYSLQAVFAALDRAPKTYDVDPMVAEQRQALASRRSQLSQQIQTLQDAAEKQAGPRLVQLDAKIGLLAEPRPGEPSKAEAYGYHSQIMPTADSAKWVQIDLGEPRRLSRLVLHACNDSFANIGEGFGFPARFKVEVANDPEFKTEVTLVGDHTQADFANPRLSPVTFSVNGQAARYVRVTATKLALRQNDYIFALSELSAFDVADANVSAGAKVTALDSIEAPPRWRMVNLVDRYYAGGNIAGDPEELARLRLERQELLEEKTDPQTRQQLAGAKRELTSAEAAIAKLPPLRTVYAGTVHTGTGTFVGTGHKGGEPREIFVLYRGDVRNPRQPVGPGTPPIIEGVQARFELGPDATEGDRRVALAKWITDPRHPLTWRSIVNRVWQYHIGRGIVDSPNDFGRMGQLPTHPELLDWLAVEFRDGGQSIKSLHRLICNSSTYRQSSSENAQKAAVDSGNMYLWRMNRRRLEAEAIRDSVLHVAGKLDLTMGGPGFQDFVVENPAHSPHYKYNLFDPTDPRAHRRSIYRFIVRSQPQPFMATLNCADPSMSVDKRNESLTALQALAMLNNKFVVTMSEFFAERLETEGVDLSTQVQQAFRLALGRDPLPEEQQAVVKYAQEYGLANACRVIFNFSEFAFVD